MRRREIATMPTMPANIIAQAPGSGIAATLKLPVAVTFAAVLSMLARSNFNLRLLAPPRSTSEEFTIPLSKHQPLTARREDLRETLRTEGQAS